MINQIIYPYLCVFFVSLLCLIFNAQPRRQSLTSAIGSGVLVAFALNLFLTVQNHGVQVLQLGGWTSPYGITLVADLTSSLLVLVTAIIFFAVNIFSLDNIDNRLKRKNYYFYMNLLVLGAIWAYFTGDLFNLYVSFEILLVASFLLLTLGATNAGIKQAVPYILINIIASFAFLVGIALLYGHTGNLNLAYLASLLRKTQWTYGVRTAGVFIFFAFALKSAMFPLFFWLPKSYPTVPGAVGALFSAVMTKIGVYGLLRIFSLVFPIARDPSLQNILYYCALLTMVTGVLGALAQSSIKRILSVHIISQVGYMLWGLALFSPISLGATLFFMIHNMVVKSNLFLVAGLIEKSEGTDELENLGGELNRDPFFSSLFLLSGLSLAGLPPLSGFFAKLFLIKEGLSLQDFLGITTAAMVSLLTLFSMTKIWNEVFLKDPPLPPSGLVKSRFGMAPILFLALFAVILGALSGPIYEIFIAAGESLFEPSAYITAVLGKAS